MSEGKKQRVEEDRIFVKKLYIENFKSIKHLELELKPGINVLVGPNSSGKTNVLEALDFLRRALIDYAGRIPYAPHMPRYWSGKDLIYGRDPSKVVMIGILLEHYHIVNEKERNVYRHVVEFKTYFRYSPQLDTLVPFKYHAEIWPGFDVIELSPNHIRVETKVEIIEKLSKAEKLPEKLPRGSILKQLLKRFKSTYKREGDRYIYEAEANFPEPLLFFDIFSFPLSECAFQQSHGICASMTPIPSKTSPSLIPILYGYYEKYDETSIVPGLTLFNPPILIKTIRETLRRVGLIRHPDIGALTEPKPYQGELRLDDRATNLASVLLALQGVRGGLPESFSDAMAKLFPGFSIKVNSYMGKVALEAEENGLELPPPNIPDGVIKLLAIMAAVELEPSILLADEIENSMHAKMLEYIVDRLNSLSIPVIVATHSPIVVDLVEPSRVLIVFRDAEHGTYVEKIEEPEELYQELKQLGIALSDYVFYRLTYEES